MKKLVMLFVSFSLFFPPLMGEEKGEWTLEQVFSKVLRENEFVLSAEREVDIARAVRRGAYSAVVPNANFAARLTRYGERQAFDLGEGDSFEIIPQTDWNYIVNVRQVLFAGGRTWRALKYTGNLEEMAERSNLRVRQDVLLLVSAAYLAIIKAQENLEISRKSYELAQRQLRTASSLFRAGESIRTSVLRAEVNVSRSERDIIVSQNRLNKAREDFATISNIRGEYILSPIETRAVPEGDIEELVSRAMENREEMEMITLQLTNADLNVKIQRGERFPVLTADFNYVRQKSDFPTSSWYNFVLGFSIPVFDGGEIGAKVEVAKQEKAQVLLEKSALEKRIREEVTLAYLDLQDILRAIEVLETEVELSRLSYEDISRLFAAGEATDLDILEADRSMINAERLLAILLNDRILANFSLQNSIGIFARDQIEEEMRHAR